MMPTARPTRIAGNHRPPEAAHTAQHDDQKGGNHDVYADMGAAIPRWATMTIPASPASDGAEPEDQHAAGVDKVIP